MVSPSDTVAGALSETAQNAPEVCSGATRCNNQEPQRQHRGSGPLASSAPLWRSLVSAVDF